MIKRLLNYGICTFFIFIFPLSVETQVRKTNFTFPDAGEYKVLKADFHIHTVFSDGLVWPYTRLDEAYSESLDIVAIADHIEHRSLMPDVTNLNKSYEIAKWASDLYNIVLIHSAEITRDMPPGHINVIGIQDANKFEQYVNKSNPSDSSRVKEALFEAKQQGAFIFWNHPAFPTPDNKSTWHPIHQQILDEGLMMGIEVVNGERYEPIAFQWCLDHNLTIFSNTDLHGTMAQKRSIDGFKVMTLVLAKEKTEKAVMDALRNHRTIALWNNQLFGRQEHVEPVVKSCIKATLYDRGDKYLFEFVNESGFPFTLQFSVLPEGFKIRNDFAISINPYETVAYIANVSENIPSTLNVKVLNVWVTPEKNLELFIPINYKRDTSLP